jgi:hypothetical protein
MKLVRGDAHLVGLQSIFYGMGKQVHNLYHALGQFLRVDGFIGHVITG